MDSTTEDAKSPAKNEKKWQPLWDWARHSGFIVLLCFAGIMLIGVGILVAKTPDPSQQTNILTVGILGVVAFVVTVINAVTSARMADIMERQESEATKQRVLTGKILDEMKTQRDTQSKEMFATLTEMKSQRRIAEQQTAIALQQLRMTDRPWLDAHVMMTTPLTFNGGAIDRLGCVIVARNVGRSVAINATINAEFFIPPRNAWEEVLAKQAEMCQNVRHEVLSYTIFPEKDQGLRMSRNLNQQEVEAGRMGQYYVGIYLVGCVDYQLSGHDTHHQTRFVYELRNGDAPDVFGNDRYIGIGHNVPLESLVLRKPIFSGGDYAD